MIQPLRMNAVHVIDFEEIEWPYDHGKNPYILVGSGKYKRRIEVDPFPCYCHDSYYAHDMFQKLLKLFPISMGTSVWLLPYEDYGRTNGWTQYDWTEKYPEDKAAFVSDIVLAGKRTPIHPALTRYSMAHEYGHVIENVLNAEAGGDLASDDFIEKYNVLRGLRRMHATGRKWHDTAAEVFADDFRILVAGIDDFFWPHTISHPAQDLSVVQWWRDLVSSRSEQK